ncbi:MAG: hypothetical protein ACT6T0_17130, partial [Nevskia sp.]
GTVEAAYALLGAEGYIQARGQAGTIVTPGLKPRMPVALPERPPRSGSAAAGFRPDSILPFQLGLPALDAFPRKIWARLGARCVRAMQPADMAHPPVQGLPALRAEIAAYLQVSRGIACSASQVFVTSGYRQTMELIAHALLKEGDRVLGAHFSIDAPPGGMHLVLRLKARRSDRRLAARLREEGLSAEALSDWAMDAPVAPALLLGFTNIETQAMAEKLGARGSNARRGDLQHGFAKAEDHAVPLGQPAGQQADGGAGLHPHVVRAVQDGLRFIQPQHRCTAPGFGRREQLAAFTHL